MIRSFSGSNTLQTQRYFHTVEPRCTYLLSIGERTAHPVFMRGVFCKEDLGFLGSRFACSIQIRAKSILAQHVVAEPIQAFPMPLPVEPPNWQARADNVLCPSVAALKHVVFQGTFAVVTSHGKR